MNHETAVAMAVVLAVIVITILYTMVSGGIGLGDEGIDNISQRAEDEGSGSNLGFTSLQEKGQKPFERVQKRYKVQI